MLGPGTTWYLAVAAVLFGIGTTGVVLRRSPLIVLLSLEIMLNSANLALISFARLHGNHDGQIFALAVTGDVKTVRHRPPHTPPSSPRSRPHRTSTTRQRRGRSCRRGRTAASRSTGTRETRPRSMTR